MTLSPQIPKDLLQEAAQLIREAHYLLALTGAGMSVESGIPPFRGPGGIWTKHGEPPMDGFQRFMADPKKAWEERLNPTGPMVEFREALDNAQPNPGHIALARMEEMGILKGLITQNVDNLHLKAGSRNVMEIHGNMTLLRCLGCNRRYKRGEIPLDVLPPACPACGGLIKSDGVAFGEPIPRDVLARCQEEADRCDCMLVVGTSATVYPAAAFPQYAIRRGHPVIEVNLYPSELTQMCRLSLTGPSGEVLPVLLEVMRTGQA